MLTPIQNTIITLMFLNGVLFLGLNFIAYSFVFPGPRHSKRIGYVLFTAVALAILAQQEYSMLISLDFTPEKSAKIILFGFAAPVFLVSISYYRLLKGRLQSKNIPPQNKK